MGTRIVCVVPSVRPESMKMFRERWEEQFKKHHVDLITVWDGDDPIVERLGIKTPALHFIKDLSDRDLFCRYSDVVRNYGFLGAAHLRPTHILTLDDDCYPATGYDAIQEHLDILEKQVPISWMNTAPESLYLRGFPYSIREEAPVMLSHGIWYGVPDFDGETQLKLTQQGKRPDQIPYSLPYYKGPVPEGVLMPICGMNLMFRREALPYMYFAPMGKDSGYPDLHRFGDIWMGVEVKKEFDKLGWAIYSGGAPIVHSRASDPHKNFENEKLGRKWNEWFFNGLKYVESWPDKDYVDYFNSYQGKKHRYKMLIKSILGGTL